MYTTARGRIARKRQTRQQNLKSKILNPKNSPEMSKSPSSRKKQKVPPSGGATFPDGWEQAQLFHVYDGPYPKGSPTTRGGVRQGIWKSSFGGTVPNPCEVWVFDNQHIPESLEDCNNRCGVWGYKPGSEKSSKPEDIWFFPPVTKHNSKLVAGTKLPSYFQPQGKWSFPVRKRDISSIEPNEAGFLNIGRKEKHEKLDVAGNWRLLYKRADEEDEQPEPTARIHIQKPNGQQFTLDDVKLKDDTIGDIKDRVNKKLGIPNDEQRLHFNGQRLNDDRPTLDDCGIQNEDTLVLSPMIVYVEDKKNNDIYTVQVDPDDSIRKVKDKLEKQEGLPPIQKQGLTYKNKPLNDKPTLRDYGIPHEAMLVLEPMHIHIVKDEKKIATLDVTPNDTIHEIKTNIKLLCGIPVEEQRLVVEPDSNEDLEDQRTLQKYGIKHNDTLYLEPMQVHVRTPVSGSKPQKVMTFLVKPTTKIVEIKNLVKSHPDSGNMDPKDQRLLLPKDGHLPLEDNSKALKDYGVKHNDVLDLEGMRIIIKDVQTGNKFPLNVEPNHTIDSIKDQIYDKESIPKDNQYLLFGGNLLDDPDKTLDDHDIKHMNVINLDKMKVYVKDWKGKTFTMYVDPKDTTQDLKKKIKDRENIPIKDQILKFDGNVLDDPSATVKDNGIKYLDTLNLDKPGPPMTPLKSPKSVVKSAPTTPENLYTVQMSPWKSLEGGYVKKNRIKRDGKRAGTHEQFKTRYTTSLETDLQELTLMSMEKYTALNNKQRRGSNGSGKQPKP